jgi:hypothetical protein
MNTLGSKGIKIDDKVLSDIIDATSGRATVWTLSAEEVRTLAEEAEKRLVVLACRKGSARNNRTRIECGSRQSSLRL